MNEADKIIGANVARLRALAGFSQTSFAKAAHDAGLPFHQPTVHRVEAGLRPIRLIEAPVLAHLLNIEVIDLIGGFGDQTSVVPLGSGDEMDLASGRCCPVCRHLITDHNAAVWNSGYATGRRHTQEVV